MCTHWFLNQYFIGKAQSYFWLISKKEMMFSDVHYKKCSQEWWCILLSNIVWKAINLPLAFIVAKAWGTSDYLGTQCRIPHSLQKK